MIGEFCQDEETKEQLFKAYHEDVYFKKIIAKLEEDSRNAWKKCYFWSKDKGLFLLEDPVWRLCIPKGSLSLKAASHVSSKCIILSSWSRADLPSLKPLFLLAETSKICEAVC